MYELAHIIIVLLSIINDISQILIPVLQQIENRQDLSVERDQAFSDEVPTENELLELMESVANDCMVFSAQGILDRDDNIWDHWKDSVFSVLQEIIQSFIDD